MEQLPEHEQEVDYRCNVSDGLEVQLVWNSLMGLAYTRVEDSRSGESFSAVTPDGVHPRESFLHPYMYRIEHEAVAEEVAEAVGHELGSE